MCTYEGYYQLLILEHSSLSNSWSVIIDGISEMIYFFTLLQIIGKPSGEAMYFFSFDFSGSQSSVWSHAFSQKFFFYVLIPSYRNRTGAPP
jgi:hypothetical protein